MDNPVTNYTFNPKWPFRMNLGNPERWDRRNCQWIPLEDHKQDVWFDGTKRVVMERRKVLWILYHGEIPEGFVVIYNNRLKEDHIDNLGIMKVGRHISMGISCRHQRKVKLLAHRLELLKILPSSFNFQYFAKRWGCNKGSLLNARSVLKSHKIGEATMNEVY